MRFTRNQLFAGGVSLAVTAAVIVGLMIAGSPSAERMRRADEQRVRDLQQISFSIDVYWDRNGTLPTSLADLARSPDTYLPSITDPKTGIAYEYRPRTDGEYHLCATFETDSESGPDQPAVPQPAGFWTHGIGERCYPLEARTDGLKPAPMLRVE